MSWYQNNYGGLVNLDGVKSIFVTDAADNSWRLPVDTWGVVAWIGPNSADFRMLFQGTEVACQSELDRIMHQLVPNPPGHRLGLPKTGPR